MKKFTCSLITSLLLFTGTQGVSAFDEDYLPPGEVYLMFQQFRMYIDCQGEGSIPVIVEPGIGDSLANWLPIQQELSKHTKVCLYDRAGMGLSDPGPGPRTPSQIATELYYLLEKAKVEGPYIFVGHSFGGSVAMKAAMRGDTARLRAGCKRMGRTLSQVVMVAAVVVVQLNEARCLCYNSARRRAMALLRSA